MAAVTAEQGLIGNLFISDSANEVYNILSVDAFHDEICKRIYSELLHSFKETGKIPEAYEVAAKLKNESFTDEAIMQYLKNCISNSDIGLVSIGTAKAMMEEYNFRKLQLVFNEQGISYEERRNKINAILNSDIITTIPVTAADALTNYSNEYFKPKETQPIKTGFLWIDKRMIAEAGDIVVIAARPSVGKSAFATQIATNIAEQKKKVLYFNLEMTEKQIFERIISRFSGINITRLRKAENISDLERQPFNDALKRLNDIGDNLQIVTGRRSIADIWKICKTKKPDAVFIDYLQLVKFQAVYKNNRYADIAEVSHSLKEIATELNIPIFILSQLNRESARDGKEPTMGEIRESGDIEQDASIIILLWNKDETRKTKCLKIEKNRQGDTATTKLEFIGGNMTFTEEKSDFAKIDNKTNIPF